MALTALVTIGGVAQPTGTLVAYLDTSVRGMQSETSLPPFGPYKGQPLYQMMIYAAPDQAVPRPPPYPAASGRRLAAQRSSAARDE